MTKEAFNIIDKIEKSVSDYKRLGVKPENIRVSIPNYYIEHLRHEYASIARERLVYPERSKICGVDIIPAYEDAVTIFNINMHNPKNPKK
jgi:hypothetical protein